MRGKRRTASAYSSRFGPGSAPSRSTSVHSTCVQPVRQVTCDRVPQARARSAAPSRASQARHAVCVEAHVERQHDALGAELLQPGLRPRAGFVTADAADDDARARPRPSRSSPRPRGCGRRRRPGCAAPTPRRQSRDHAAVALRAVARAVEVDDVQPARAERAVALEHSSTGRRRRRVSASKSPLSSRTQRPPRRSMAGMSMHVRPAARKLASMRAPDRAPSARDETACRGSCRCRTTAENRRRSPWSATRPRADRRGVAVHEVDVVAVDRCRRAAASCGRGSSWFQPMCGTGRPGRPAKPRHAPGTMPRHVASSPFLAERRTAAACRGRCRAPAASASE